MACRPRELRRGAAKQDENGLGVAYRTVYSKATTGLPVTAIGYNPDFRPYSMRFRMRIRDEKRWYHESIFAPSFDRTIRGRGFFISPGKLSEVTAAMITIQNLTKTYRTKSGAVEALRGISAEIQDGDIFGIIGLSGARKIHPAAVHCSFRRPPPPALSPWTGRIFPPFGGGSSPNTVGRSV